MVKYLKYLILLLPNLLNGQNTLTGDWLGNSRSNSIIVLIFNSEDSLTLKNHGKNGKLLSISGYNLIDNESKNYLNSSNEKNETLSILESDIKYLKIKLSPIKDTLELYKSNVRYNSSLLDELFTNQILELSILENELIVKREILYNEGNSCYKLRPKYTCFERIFYSLKSSKNGEVNILELKTSDYIYSTILITESQENLIRGISLSGNKVVELKSKEWVTENSYDSLMVGEWAYVFEKEGLGLDSLIYKDYPRIMINKDLNYEMKWNGGEEYARIKYEKIDNDILSILFRSNSEDIGYRLIVKEIKGTHVIFSQIKCIMNSEDWEEDIYWKKIK